MKWLLFKTAILLYKSLDLRLGHCVSAEGSFWEDSHKPYYGRFSNDEKPLHETLRICLIDRELLRNSLRDCVRVSNGWGWGCSAIGCFWYIQSKSQSLWLQRSRASAKTESLSTYPVLSLLVSQQGRTLRTLWIIRLLLCENEYVVNKLV